jgi:outer membrane protein OmpA-like peptidoglycan-associated protein
VTSIPSTKGQYWSVWSGLWPSTLEVKKLKIDTSTLNRLLVCGVLFTSMAGWGLPRPSEELQQAAPEQIATIDPITTFHVTVVEHTTMAVNYHFRSGSTKVDLQATDLMPGAKGTAKVESHLGRINLHVQANRLDSPQKFGTEYLTYVLWAITPEGRASNLGEIVPGDDDRKLDVTTDLQAFGLVVTAEPYFGVTQPSDVVVLENRVRPDTVGATEYIEAKYELVGRGQYIPRRSEYAPLVLDPKTPLYLEQARNAVRIAQLSGGEKYASESFAKAAKLLQQAEDYQARRKPQQKPVATVAREAVQASEDARLISVRRRHEEELANERQAGADREAKANHETQRANDETQRANAAADAQSDAANKARNDAEAARLAQAKAESDSAQSKLDAANAAALAQQQAAKAEAEKAELRAKLLQQLNAVLETRDTSRGLIVNMSDVLFETDKYALRAVARERLAKIAGIVLANPDLHLVAEGHTDSVGTEAYNQQLSEQRAGSVKDYLVQQGIPSASVTSQGFGKSQPVASNDNAAGRQQNRRVELVVSGDAIGKGAVVISGGQD